MKRLWIAVLTLVLLIGAAALAEDGTALPGEDVQKLRDWLTEARKLDAAEKPEQIVCGKVLVVVLGYGDDIATTIPGTELEYDFGGIPEEIRADSLDGADTVVLIYPKWKTIGYYSTGMGIEARRTFTSVCAVDVPTGVLSLPFTAVTTDPPETVEIPTINGIPTRIAFSGDFEAQKAIGMVADMLVPAEVEQLSGAGHAGFPAEMAGTWHGTGIPKNGGTEIDLTATIRDDGTGEYVFRQGGYTESYPITLSATDRTFTVDISVSGTMSKAEGTWSLENGVLKIDITTTFVNGRTYSYTAECTAAAE